MPKDHFKSDRHLRLSQQYSSQDMVRDAREIQRIMQRKKPLPKKQPFWQPNTVKAILVALPPLRHLVRPKPRLVVRDPDGDDHLRSTTSGTGQCDLTTGS